MSSTNNYCLLIKVFLLVLITTKITSSLSIESINNDLRFIKHCNQTSPISLRTMNEVLINKKLSNRESTAFKCFLHCLFTKYGWMDEDGGFLLHDIKKTLEESDIEITSLEFILYKCTAIESIDRCERSFIFTQCFWDKISEQQSSEDQLFYNIEKRRK